MMGLGVPRKVAALLDADRAAADVTDALAGAGITVGGDAPWDIQIRDPRTFARVLRDGTLGVGETFVEGWWDCQALDQMIASCAPGSPTSSARAGRCARSW